MTEQVSFLGLPCELRDLVYPYVSQQISHQTSQIDCFSDYIEPSGAPPSLLTIENAPVIGLLLCCKQIQAEYLESSLKKLAVTLHPDVAFTGHRAMSPIMIQILRKASHLKLLRHIQRQEHEEPVGALEAYCKAS